MQTTVISRRIAARARSTVVKAFRRMAGGAGDKSAYAATIRFYRSSGQAWTKQLSA